jgi:hypothetical protein
MSAPFVMRQAMQTDVGQLTDLAMRAKAGCCRAWSSAWARANVVRNTP